jgi:hypothetical protein
MRFGKRDSPPPSSTPPSVPPQYRKETVTGARSHGAAARQPQAAAADNSRSEGLAEARAKESNQARRDMSFLWHPVSRWPALLFPLRQALRNVLGFLAKGLLYPPSFILFALAIIFGVAAWDQHTFKAMTPAQHLDAARAALGDKHFDDGLYQLSAIKPGAPESADAKELEGELTAAKEAAQRDQAAPQEAARIAERQREAVVQQLQARLSELGYAVTVAPSDKPGEIVITSKDLGDTDHRVRFLAFLRGRNSPATSACFAGFHTVRLSSGLLSPIWGFSEAYSLDCFGSP